MSKQPIEWLGVQKNERAGFSTFSAHCFGSQLTNCHHWEHRILWHEKYIWANFSFFINFFSKKKILVWQFTAVCVSIIHICRPTLDDVNRRPWKQAGVCSVRGDCLEPTCCKTPAGLIRTSNVSSNLRRVGEVLLIGRHVVSSHLNSDDMLCAACVDWTGSSGRDEYVFTSWTHVDVLEWWRGLSSSSSCSLHCTADSKLLFKRKTASI